MLWLDGYRLEGTVAPFDLRDRGLLLGDGVFDTALALNGRVVLGGRHMDRLAGSCAALGIPFDPAAAGATLSEAAEEIGTGAVRITVTRGPGPRGLAPPPDPEPRLLVSAQAGPPAALWRPVGAVLSTIRRNETSPTSRHKCLGYLDAVLALRTAAGEGADEALFLNTSGNLACCATGNLFVIAGETLKTPPLTDGVLAGVLRAEILDLAPIAGLTPVEVSLTPSELASADAVFMTNSLRLIAPIVTLDAAPLAMLRLRSVARLARVLIGRIQQSHGPCPSLEKGPASWPVSA